MSSTAIDDEVASLHAAVDGLLSADLTSTDGLGLVALLEAVEVQRRRLDAVDVRLLAEIDERRVAGDFGRSTTADLMVHRLRVTTSEAKARVARAQDLGPRRELSGAPLPPVLPATSAALHTGEISAAHTMVIAKALDALPADIACEASGPAEDFLVDAARQEDPARLRQSAHLLLERLDPDGRTPREDADDRRRDFTLHGRGNGSSAPRGLLTGHTTAIWNTILDALSKPHVADDGTHDNRTPGQRRQDAFLEAGLRLLRSGTLPESGGVPATVLVTTTDKDLAEVAAGGTGLARTAHGDLISLRRLLNLSDGESGTRRSPSPARCCTTAAPSAWPPRRYDAPWPPATAAAASPAARAPPPGPRLTTSSPGSTAGSPTSTTSASSARSTTASSMPATGT